ncbi:MAG: hypothetical protein ACM3H9_10905, partial [Rhodospirillaceae bacterium]
MTAFSILLAAVLAAQSPAKPVSAGDYVGRWNVIITDAADTFVSGGIRIDKAGAGLSGGLVWRWGSYAPVQSVEVVDGMLRIARDAGEGKQDRFEARLENGMLKGQVTYPDGKVHHFEGRKAPLMPSFKTSAAW